jgi:hypothetical protein
MILIMIGTLVIPNLVPAPAFCPLPDRNLHPALNLMSDPPMKQPTVDQPRTPPVPRGEFTDSGILAETRTIPVRLLW